MEASSISWSDLERVVFNIMWYCVKEWWCFFSRRDSCYYEILCQSTDTQSSHHTLKTCALCSHSADKISGFRSKTQLVHYIQYELLSHIPYPACYHNSFYFMWVPNYTLRWSKSCRDGEGFGLPQALVNIIHILHGVEGNIPEYLPRGDRKAL